MFTWLDPVNNWDISALLVQITKLGYAVYDAFGNLVAFFGTPVKNWFGDKWAAVIEKFPDLSGGMLGIILQMFAGDDAFSIPNFSILDLITTAVVVVVIYTFIKWIVGIITG